MVNFVVGRMAQFSVNRILVWKGYKMIYSPQPVPLEPCFKNSWDKMGFVVLRLAKALKQASTELLIRACHEAERSQAIKEKYVRIR